jgi:molybdopterin molybdotransferase
VEAVLSRNLPSQGGQTEYIRVKLEQTEDKLIATPVFGRSGILSTLTAADGFLIIPAGKEGLNEGETTAVFLWE